MLFSFSVEPIFAMNRPKPEPVMTFFDALYLRTCKSMGANISRRSYPVILF